jgi:hypothetical protein
MIGILTARVVPLLPRLDMVLYHHHRPNLITCNTTAVGTRAPLLHPHPRHLLLVTVARTMMRTIVVGRDTTIGIHSTVNGEDAIGVGVVGRTTTRVAVIECMVGRHIRRRDRFEPGIESETALVGCYITRTRRSIIITIIIGGTETMTLIVNIIILLLPEVEIKARVVAEGAVAGVTAEMRDGVDGCARIAENEILGDPAGGVEETTSPETTRDTRASREPKRLDLADGIATKIT